MIQSCIYNKFNQQLLININRKKYYMNVIANNNKIINSPFPPKYPPEYFQTAYDRIYRPNISTVPN